MRADRLRARAQREDGVERATIATLRVVGALFELVSVAVLVALGISACC